MIDRRTFLRSAGAFGLCACAPALRVDEASSAFCSAGSGRPLALPAADGWFARHAPSGERFAIRAGRVDDPSMPWRTAYTIASTQAALRNPTLVVQRGERVRVRLENALDAPTIVHWHGVANDTRNDGGGLELAAPGTSYEYDFTVHERSGLYWYHPHPHGAVGRQVYEGLFGLFAVEDDDERALRRALDLRWGATELPLILQDRRGSAYAIDDRDRLHGMLGREARVNGCADAYVDVATRPYRFRVLNASSARTYLLAFRDAAGRARDFVLLGTDGGLLEAPVRCTACYLSPAERIDVLIDLSDAALGDAFVLHTRAFDAMHSKHAAPAAADAMHSQPAPQRAAAGATHEHVHSGARPNSGHEPEHEHHAHDHGGWPEGAERALLALRVRERIRSHATLPARLSQPGTLDAAGARERALRLGFNKARWRINDRTFAMNETPIELPRDTTEVWLLRNYHTSMPHAMHLHGTLFRVLERETSPDQLAPLVVDKAGRVATDLGWKDTLLVWPGESVRIAVRFEGRYPGPQTYMFHCHNLEHEDGGMMLGVRVT
jgi:suppressor of ftsI/bilirubin oxidase